ncbi:hypothetical protein ACQEVY_13085 [Streptomyces sp. CA-288835]|uniref:hypothetical protein n=1 Tax=Streptomyces sp. CA-288835 TaxID=3240069 RepID=UPI003D93B1F6
MRLAAKFYVWQLLNNTDVRAIRRAGSKRMAPRTIANSFINGLRFILEWLAKRGITEFCQVTNAVLDDYLIALVDDEVPLDRCYRRLVEIRRLWAHRHILPPQMRLEDSPPWGGADTQDLLERTHRPRANRTPRIGEPTMQMLLIWALRFTEDFAEDILAAHAEYLDLHDRTPQGRRASGKPRAHRHQAGELKPQVIAYIEKLKRGGEGLPGHLDDDGQLEISWAHLAAILNCSQSLRNSSSGLLIRDSGLPVVEGTYLDAPITGQWNGQPWREKRITYREAPQLARLLSTACFVIIAYLSGARAGEVLNLRRGCVERDGTVGLWLMHGLYFKGAEDQDGNKLPTGEARADPWIIIEVVADAIDILERLHPHQLLFPTRIEAFHRRRKSGKRLGEARSDQRIAEDLAAFVHWVNTECDRHGRTDLIPDDGRGRLAASRFRRTLAWFIRRRPRGLIAASIQYGHAYTQMLQGYAGDYDSGFPDEYAFEEWLYRLECLAEDEQALVAGEHVSGPAADAYRHRVSEGSRVFAGRVLKSDRQARDLLGNRLLQIHHGRGMTCVLTPDKAACQLRGTIDDPLVTPDTDDCRPNCLNLARTDRDIECVEQKVAELTEIVSDPLAPPIRHERERHELARQQAILDAHKESAAE